MNPIQLIRSVTQQTLNNLICAGKSFSSLRGVPGQYEVRAGSASVPQAFPGQERQGQNNTLEKSLQGIRHSSSVTDLQAKHQIRPHPGRDFQRPEDCPAPWAQ